MTTNRTAAEIRSFVRACYLHQLKASEMGILCQCPVHDLEPHEIETVAAMANAAPIVMRTRQERNGVYHYLRTEVVFDRRDGNLYGGTCVRAFSRDLTPEEAEAWAVKLAEVV